MCITSAALWLHKEEQRSVFLYSNHFENSQRITSLCFFACCGHFSSSHCLSSTHDPVINKIQAKVRQKPKKETAGCLFFFLIANLFRIICWAPHSGHHSYREGSTELNCQSCVLKYESTKVIFTRPVCIHREAVNNWRQMLKHLLTVFKFIKHR